MDREILFRGKRIDNGKLVYGYIVRVHHRGEKGKIESYFFNALDELGWAYECVVSAETVCQYTGLNDSTKWEELSEGEKEKFLSELNHREDRLNTKEDWNGRKIFEGDIVKCNNKRGAAFWRCKVAWNEVKARFDVINTDCEFPMCLDGLGHDIPINGSDYEIIGNVFDNLELLEGGAE